MTTNGFKKMIGIAISTFLFLITSMTFPVVAGAQGDEQGGGGGWMQGKFQDRMNAHWDKMAEALKLTPQQQTLFSDMKEKAQACMRTKFQDHRALHKAIKEELAKDQPNLAGVANQAKEEFRTQETAAHDAMVDATVTFFGSLTKEQRDTFEKMRPMDHKFGKRFSNGPRGE